MSPRMGITIGMAIIFGGAVAVGVVWLALSSHQRRRFRENLRTKGGQAAIAAAVVSGVSLLAGTGSEAWGSNVRHPLWFYLVFLLMAFIFPLVAAVAVLMGWARRRHGAEWEAILDGSKDWIDMSKGLHRGYWAVTLFVIGTLTLAIFLAFGHT